MASETETPGGTSSGTASGPTETPGGTSSGTASGPTAAPGGTSSGQFVAVYCGSSLGHDTTHRETAAALGAALADAGCGVVYGGGHVGLMGVVADSALAAGARVIGVMTRSLADAEIAHRGLAELEIVETMHERKARMTALSSGVIALPGGFGTLDETFEVLTWNQLGLTASPVVFLDAAGYFDGLFDFVDTAVGAGFVREEHAAMMRRASTVDDAVAWATGPSSPFRPKWQ